MNTKKSQQGSVLVVALILSAVIAISLTSFMKLASNAAKLSDRSFYSNGAQNLVDIGLEQALWSLNNSSWTGTGGFTAWSGHAGNYQGTFPASNAYQFSQGVVGTVKVWVDTTGANPHAVSKATVTLSDGSTVSKMAEAYMSRRSYFNNGMVAKNTLNFTGNVAIDSWNSDPDNNSATAAVAYSAAVDNDSGKIASLAITTASISVGNADVYGYAAIGGSQISEISVGSTGRVGPYGTGNGTIDPTRVTYDFTTNFPVVSAPTSGSVSQSYNIASLPATLPVSGNLPASDGKYYYFIPSISMSGHDASAITAGRDVVIVITNTTGDSIRAAGNSELDVPATANLTMYAAADVTFSGNGVVNGGSVAPNQPKNFTLYGTSTTTQTMAIKGNGYLSGIVYAPNASVSVNGNGDTYGAIIANSVNMVGNGNFHYDESLANLASSNLWAVTKWRELYTQTEKNLYATQLSF